MAAIKFFTKGAANPTAIYIRFTHGRKYDYTRTTKLIVDPKFWNNKKGTVRSLAEFKDKVNLQNNLNELRNHVLNSFNDCYTAGKIINGNWLGETIDNFFDQNVSENFEYIVDYGEYFVKNLKNTVQPNGKMGVTPATFTKYKTIVNKLREFESYRKRRLKTNEINLSFHKDFIYFLHDIQLLSYGTTGRYLGFIKTIVKSAKSYGLKVSEDIEKKEFNYPREKTTFITLTEEEIKKIYNHDFTLTPYLENARDWLIIGLWTGARVSDLLKFTSKNIQNGFIEYTAKKTSQKIVLPLHPQVSNILDKLNDQFPRSISSQRFNDYIKIVCKEVGLNEIVKGSMIQEVKPKVFRKVTGKYKKWQLVTSHICRRSFATNHYGKLPTPVLMAITGHTTEKMFLNYIGKTARDNAEVLNNFWKQQEEKRNKTVKLNIIKTGTHE